MDKSKVSLVISRTISLIQLLSGSFLTFMFGLYTIAIIVDKELYAEGGLSTAIVSLIMAIIGILLIVASQKKSKLIKNFKEYVAVISNNPDGFIPDIAASLGTTENIVKKNLEQMIKKKYFANAYIDHNTNRIVILNKQPLQTSSHISEQTTNNVVPTDPQTNEVITIKCKNCGGINTIFKGTVGECNYCGSFIKGE